MSDSDTPFVEFLDPKSIRVPELLNRWKGSHADLELMRSIQTQGLLQPVGVAPNGDGGYDLAWGTRRFGAWTTSPFLKASPIPAVVVTKDAALHGTVDENVLRTQLSPLDKARVAKYAVETTKDPTVTRAGLAHSLDISPSRLSHLEAAWSVPSLWRRVEVGTLPLKSAVLLAPRPTDEVEKFLTKLDAMEPKPNTTEIERMAREFMGSGLVVDLPGDDLREKAGAVVDFVVNASPGVTGLKVRFVYDETTTEPHVTVNLPLVKGELDTARQVVAKAVAMLGDGAPTKDLAAKPEIPTSTTAAETARRSLAARRGRTPTA